MHDENITWTAMLIALLHGASGSAAARYAYSPFGEIIAASDALADYFEFRFSMKYYESEANVYYGYRFYAPVHGTMVES